MAAKKDRDPNYEKWLKDTGKDDSKRNREWYDCPEEKRSDYIKDHKSWWNKF